MRYLKFNISNFKGIESTSIDLNTQANKIITLVGLNESGKTSILEAINFLWKNYNTSDNHKLIPKDKKYNFNDRVSISAHLEFLDDEKKKIENQICKKYNFKEIVPLTNKIIITKSYNYENSELLNSQTQWTLILKAKSGKQKKFREYSSETEEWKYFHSLVSDKIPKIVYYENFLFNIPHEILIHPFDKIPVEELPFYNMLQDLLDSIDEELTIEEHLKERISKNDEASQSSLNALLNKMGGKVTNIVLKPWSEIMKSEEKKIKFYSRIEEGKFDSRDQNNRPIKLDAYYIRFDLEDGDETYPISERSLGFRWFFAFLLFTELRKHRNDDPGETLFLLDEPASNLHSTAQQKLLSIYDQLVDGGSKLIYSTHSHHLINPYYLDTAYIVRNLALNYEDEMNYDAAKTKIEATLYKSFVSSHPHQKDYFQPILDVLDYQPGLLENIPFIVVLEGKHDFYSLNYINFVILNDEYDIYIYPGFGAGKNDNIIATYLAWNRELQIFLDSDHRGKKEQTRYIEDFGPIIENKVHTYEDVESTWNNFKIESMYSDNDKDLIMKSIKPSYTTFSKKLFHMEIQNLFALRKNIGIEEDTITRFRKLFEFLGFSKK